MYFARDGSVMACCYSRNVPIGRYPEQSIDEIWRGARASSMRAALRRNELPAGCELCYPQIISRNYSGLLARGFDSQAAPPDPSDNQELIRLGVAREYPKRLEFELSNTCNLECAMCNGQFSSTIRMNREKLPPLPQVYDSAFLEQLLPFLTNVKSVSFIGGEPFLIDIYYQIWDLLMDVNPNCHISITTNGTVYTSRVKRVLENLNCQINISLDSITKGTYESIRVNGKLERTLANLEEFTRVNRKNNKPLTISVCPMISNAREMPKLVSFANERGIKVFFNTVVFPLEQSIRSLPHVEQRELAQLYRTELSEPSNDIEKSNRAALLDVAHQIEYWADQFQTEYDERQRFKAICDSFLDAGARNRALPIMASDLNGTLPCSMADVAAQHVDDPIETLVDYYGAMWNVGSVALSQGLLANVVYEPATLQALLAYLRPKLTDDIALTILREIRVSLLSTMVHVGTFSIETLIDLTARVLPRDAR